MQQTPTCRYGYVLKLILLLMHVNEQTDFQPGMNNKISHIKGLQTTIPDGLGAQTFTWCTRTLVLPPTTYIFLWLRNKIHFSVVAGTQIETWFSSRNDEPLSISFERVVDNKTKWVGCTNINRTLVLPPPTFLFLWLLNKLPSAVVEGTQRTRFSIKMNNNISHIKGLQTTILRWVGAQTFTWCTSTLCWPPTTFLFLWLRNKIHFLCCGRHTKTNMIFNQKY